MFSYYYFYFSPLFKFIISIAFLFHFYCYTYVSTVILYITTLNSRIFWISIQIPDHDFKKIVTLVQKQTLDTPLCYCCITLGTKSLLASSETSSLISPTKNYLKVPKTYNLWSISNVYEWMKCYLKFMSKRSTSYPKVSIFS